MSRMEELMSAKASGQTVPADALAQFVNRTPADADRGTTETPQRQRQIQLG